MVGLASTAPASEFAFYDFSEDARSQALGGRLLIGDPVPKMRELKSGLVKAVVTSPPHNIKKQHWKWFKEWQWRQIGKRIAPFTFTTNTIIACCTKIMFSGSDPV